MRLLKWKLTRVQNYDISRKRADFNQGGKAMEVKCQSFDKFPNKKTVVKLQFDHR
jgi:hypothetical protein